MIIELRESEWALTIAMLKAIGKLHGRYDALMIAEVIESQYTDQLTEGEE